MARNPCCCANLVLGIRIAQISGFRKSSVREALHRTPTFLKVGKRDPNVVLCTEGKRLFIPQSVNAILADVKDSLTKLEYRVQVLYLVQHLTVTVAASEKSLNRRLFVYRTICMDGYRSGQGRPSEYYG